MLRWLMITVGAALCLLVGFSPYPSYEVTLDRAPGDLRVGVPFAVGFSIRATEDGELPGALAPVVVAAIFANLTVINRGGITVLLVEQNVLRALRLSHRAYVLENGTVTLSGPSRALLADERIRRAYLGA